tara:strand:- start:612 stop:1514 length:903 start_codon:yes stop_codon:yes gene_type:complete
MIKHFIDISDFKKNELRKFLITAKKIKNNPKKYSNSLNGKYLGMLFEKQSLRTRLSFNIGMQKIGGSFVEIDADHIGFGKRESIKDILSVMSQYLDCLMIRNNNHSNLIKLSNLNIIPIINGLTDYSHPCQILSDIFTVEEKKGRIENNIVAWIGDFNNVLISLIQAAEVLEFRLNIIVPKVFIKKNFINLIKNSKYCKFYSNIKLGLENVNCVMTDVWVSMGEKKSLKKKQILKNYQITDHIMGYANKDAIFMHCLPAHRNEEVVDSVIDSKKSIVFQQAQNRMFVQQSILLKLLSDDE